MSDPHELLKEILAEVKAEREADMEAAVNYAKAFRKLWTEEVGTTLPRNWYTTVKVFHAKGLTETELYDAVMVAAGSNAADRGKYAYFCGVANTKLKQIEAAVAERIDSDRAFLVEGLNS